MNQTPRLHDAYCARDRINHIVKNTPLLMDSDLAKITGAKSIHYKLECLQKTGAFKVRGAANKILSLTTQEKQRGVITFSTGNHGKAVAYVAARQNIKAVVCLSEHVPAYRAEIIKRLGAEVSIKGKSQDEAEKNYYQVMAANEMIPVVPFDDPLIIAGQGTIALEILEKLPFTDVLMVQLSGGGLMVGIAMVAKAINPDIQIIGLSIKQSPALLESVNAGVPVEVEEKETLADSLLGGIGVDNQFTLEMVKKLVDQHLLISEEEIKEGIRYLFEHHRLIVEGAGVIGVSALLAKKIDVKGKNAVTVLTGSSINSDEYVSIIQNKSENS
ncbi:MAG: pyridoxal-phosphate dependent enzyme [Desulfobacter sp.]|nr:MAG: pyridoxal-phosphate dependent enzyme [Desulfobacter sp.]